MNTVLIGCKLPHGLRFQGSQGQEITLNGMNTAVIDGGFGLTHVDEDEAALFFATHAEAAYVKSQAVFSFQTDAVDDIADMGTDLAGEKTGFEGLNPEKPAPGMEAQDDKELKQALNMKRPVNAKAPKSKADKTAAAKLGAALAAKAA